MRTAAFTIGVVGCLVGCGTGVLATVPYLTPPGTSDGATGFGAMHRSIVEAVREQRGQREAASPIALTTSDGGGLALKSVKARGVIEGPLAVTELRLVFQNPEKRRREGRFTSALPDGAAISRFAMMIQNRWMEGEVVARPVAREVYESHLRPQRDPALLERDAGNVVGARVFPIEPHEQKELIVTYAQEVSATRPYRLHLAGL